MTHPGPTLAKQPIAPDLAPEASPRPEPFRPTLDERRRTIAEIRRLNPTATGQFLDGFGTLALRDYLAHLRHARHKQVRLAGWLQRRTQKLDAARRQLRGGLGEAA